MMRLSGSRWVSAATPHTLQGTPPPIQFLRPLTDEEILLHNTSTLPPLDSLFS